MRIQWLKLYYCWPYPIWTYAGRCPPKSNASPQHYFQIIKDRNNLLFIIFMFVCPSGVCMYVYLFTFFIFLRVQIIFEMMVILFYLLLSFDFCLKKNLVVVCLSIYPVFFISLSKLNLTTHISCILSKTET